MEQKKIIDNLVKKYVQEYSFLWSKEKLDSLLQEMNASLTGTDTTTMKQRGKTFLLKWLKREVPKAIHENPSFLKKYLELYWKPNQRGEENLTQLVTFFQKIEYEPSLEEYITWIRNYPLLKKTLEELTDHAKEKISLDTLEAIPSYPVISSLVEAYLTAYQIDIDLEEKEEKKESLEEVEYLSSDTVKSYLRSISLPLLSAEEERNLFLQLEAGNEEAGKKIAERNLRLVVSIAKKRVGRGLEFLDLIQEGNIGLLKAVDRYDIHKGYRFSTYATWWIRQAMDRAIADLGATIRKPVHVIESGNRILKIKRNLTARLFREPTSQEIAEEAGIPVSKVEELLKAQLDTVSIHQTIGDDEETELQDFIADESDNYEGIMQTELRAKLFEAMDFCGLSPREKTVIILRFGLDTGVPRTLEEVGHQFHLTRERVRQIEAKALRKLRRPKGRYLLNSFSAHPEDEASLRSKVPSGFMERPSYTISSSETKKKITDFISDDVDRIAVKARSLQAEYQAILYRKFGKYLENPQKPLSDTDEFLWREGILPSLKFSLQEKDTPEELQELEQYRMWKKKMLTPPPKPKKVELPKPVLKTPVIEKKEKEKTGELPKVERTEEPKMKERKTRKGKPFYTCFEGFTREQVESVLGVLKEKDLGILYRKYGETLEEVCPQNITKSENVTIYQRIFPKLKKALAEKYLSKDEKQEEGKREERPVERKEEPSKEEGKQEKKHRRSLKSIYIYFKEEEETVVDFAISQLSEKEKQILDHLFGEDYHQPQKGTLTAGERAYLFRKVLPHLTMLIQSKKEIVSSEVKTVVPEDIFSTLPILPEEWTKEDYERMKTYLQRKEYQEEVSTLPLDACVVTSLALSMVGKREVSFNELKTLLGWTSEEVATALKQGIFQIKERFDKEVEEEEKGQVKKLGGLS